MRLIACVLLAGCLGCQSAYPKFLDSPELKTAMVEAIRDSNKTWRAEARTHNPEIEFYYKIALGGRIVGVDGEIGSQGAAGPQVSLEDLNEVRARLDAAQAAYAKAVGLVDRPNP
jgi:hypothetical protein